MQFTVAQFFTFFDQLDTPWKRKEFFPTSFHLILHDDDRARAVHVITQWLQAKGRE
jgi:hypothetical protein